MPTAPRRLVRRGGAQAASHPCAHLSEKYVSAVLTIVQRLRVCWVGSSNCPDLHSLVLSRRPSPSGNACRVRGASAKLGATNKGGCEEAQLHGIAELVPAVIQAYAQDPAMRARTPGRVLLESRASPAFTGAALGLPEPWRKRNELTEAERERRTRLRLDVVKAREQHLGRVACDNAASGALLRIQGGALADWS